MDAVGASNPNNKLEFEQIILRPRDPLVQREPNLVGTRMGRFTVEKGENDRKGDILRDTLNTFQEVRKAFGAHTMRDFFLNLRKMIQIALNRAMFTNGNLQMGNKKKSELSRG